jgi:hypothetical protein
VYNRADKVHTKHGTPTHGPQGNSSMLVIFHFAGRRRSTERDPPPALLASRHSRQARRRSRGPRVARHPRRRAGCRSPPTSCSGCVARCPPQPPGATPAAAQSREPRPTPLAAHASCRSRSAGAARPRHHLGAAQAPVSHGRSPLPVLLEKGRR